MLKSAKLTGIWEGRLRAIEAGNYSAAEFIDQLKQMIYEITRSVMSDNSNRRIVAEQPTEGKKETRQKKSTKKK